VQFIVSEHLFDVNCPAQLSEISQRRQHANPVFGTSMLGWLYSCGLAPTWTEK